MSPPLNVQNAQVSTVKVEIKTLTISGKQVTLAVFRQLIEEQLIMEDGRRKGVAWGTVNYHPDQCRDYAPHWHVVWQLGDELRRSKVNMTYEPEEVFWSKALTQLYAACVHHWLATGEVKYFQHDIFKVLELQDVWNRRNWVDSYSQTHFPDKETGIEIGFHVPKEAKAAVLAKSDLIGVGEDWERKKQQTVKAGQDLDIAMEYLSAASQRGFRRPKAPENHPQDCTCPECLCSDPRKATDHVRKAEERLQEAKQRASEYSPDSAKEEQAQAALSAALTALHDRYATKPLDALWTAFHRELRAEAARRKRHVNTRKEIADLPQLFIAV